MNPVQSTNGNKGAELCWQLCVLFQEIWIFLQNARHQWILGDGDLRVWTTSPGMNHPKKNTKKKYEKSFLKMFWTHIIFPQLQTASLLFYPGHWIFQQKKTVDPKNLLGLRLMKQNLSRKKWRSNCSIVHQVQLSKKFQLFTAKSDKRNGRGPVK